MAATPAAGEQHRGCGDGEHGDNGPKHQRDHPRGGYRESFECAFGAAVEEVTSNSRPPGPKRRKRIGREPEREENLRPTYAEDRGPRHGWSFAPGGGPLSRSVSRIFLISFHVRD